MHVAALLKPAVPEFLPLVRKTSGICAIVTLALTVCACSTSPNNPNTAGDNSLAGRVKVCRTGDTPINSSDACLQDDAACYQLRNGSWCTGPRGTQCPAGSEELPGGVQCPTGNRCFTISEGKNCAISFK